MSKGANHYQVELPRPVYERLTALADAQCIPVVEALRGLITDGFTMREWCSSLEHEVHEVRRELRELRAEVDRGFPRPPVPSAAKPLHVGDLTFDPAGRELSMQGVQVRLTPTENRLLLLLITHAGETLSAVHIRDEVWKEAPKTKVGAVKVNIVHLREKIGALPGNSLIIETLPHVGYRLVLPLTPDAEEK
jgi:DNA-binding winged helix-turn-helix (wHTH) protein